MDEAPLLVPLGITDYRGTWFRHRDGDVVVEMCGGGHVWRPASATCIFCTVAIRHSVAPNTERCPARFEELPCD